MDCPRARAWTPEWYGPHCGLGHIIPVVHTLAWGQSINLRSAINLGYYCLNSLFLRQMSHLMTKPTKWLCAQQRLISLGICPVWSESWLCTQWVAKDPSFLHVDSKDWSDWADAQADLSLCWEGVPFCWFCHEASQMWSWNVISKFYSSV